MFTTGGSIIMGTPRAQRTKNGITGLTKQQFLIYMNRTLGYNFSPLPGHQIQELVDKERRGKGGYPSARYVYEFSAYWTSKRSGVSSLRGGYSS